MSSKNAERVGCYNDRCKWRGRRVWQLCPCYDDMCRHSGYGACPKCGQNVWHVDTLRRWREYDKAEMA
jgi:hypothetical protein